MQNSGKVVAEPNKVSRKTFFIEKRKKNFGNNFFFVKMHELDFFHFSVFQYAKKKSAAANRSLRF